MFEIPTCERQTSWLFAKRIRGIEVGTIPRVVSMRGTGTGVESTTFKLQD